MRNLNKNFKKNKTKKKKREVHNNFSKIFFITLENLI